MHSAEEENVHVRSSIVLQQDVSKGADTSMTLFRLLDPIDDFGSKTNEGIARRTLWKQFDEPARLACKVAREVGGPLHTARSANEIKSTLSIARTLKLARDEGTHIGELFPCKEGWSGRETETQVGAGSGLAEIGRRGEIIEHIVHELSSVPVM